MPAELPKEQVDNAWTAIEFAHSVRKVHRRKSSKGTPQREADIQTALDRLKNVMLPLRKEVGRFPYGPQTTTADANRALIREASAAIQSERRKLWKMQKRKEQHD